MNNKNTDHDKPDPPEDPGDQTITSEMIVTQEKHDQQLQQHQVDEATRSKITSSINHEGRVLHQQPQPTQQNGRIPAATNPIEREVRTVTEATNPRFYHEEEEDSKSTSVRGSRSLRNRRPPLHPNGYASSVNENRKRFRRHEPDIEKSTRRPGLQPRPVSPYRNLGISRAQSPTFSYGRIFVLDENGDLQHILPKVIVPTDETPPPSPLTLPYELKVCLEEDMNSTISSYTGMSTLPSTWSTRPGSPVPYPSDTSASDNGSKSLQDPPNMNRIHNTTHVASTEGLMDWINRRAQLYMHDPVQNGSCGSLDISSGENFHYLSNMNTYDPLGYMGNINDVIKRRLDLERCDESHCSSHGSLDWYSQYQPATHHYPNPQEMPESICSEELLKAKPEADQAPESSSSVSSKESSQPPPLGRRPSIDNGSTDHDSPSSLHSRTKSMMIDSTGQVHDRDEESKYVDESNYGNVEVVASCLSVASPEDSETLSGSNFHSNVYATKDAPSSSSGWDSSYFASQGKENHSDLESGSWSSSSSSGSYSQNHSYESIDESSRSPKRSRTSGGADPPGDWDHEDSTMHGSGTVHTRSTYRNDTSIPMVESDCEQGPHLNDATSSEEASESSESQEDAGIAAAEPEDTCTSLRAKKIMFSVLLVMIFIGIIQAGLLLRNR